MEDRLATFLREFLLKFNISTDIVAKLVSNKNLTTWIKAFTHLSWDPNYGHNYEELELLGDAIVKPIFIEYCMSKYEGVDRSQLSELVIMYLKGFTM
jgi:dsRNA-specific ribonuclease